MSASKKNLSIGFGISGILIAFFFPYGKYTTIVKKVAPTPIAAVRSVPVADTRPSPAPEPLQGAVEIQRKREEVNNAIINRLKEIRTVADNASIKIKIRIKPEAKSCQIGDFDFIKSLVHDGKNKVFLLSVEKLRGRLVKPSSIRLSLFDILKSENHEFAMPKLENAQEYGVYLCIDPGQSNTCNQKAALNSKDWNKVINHSKLPENIVYFQLLTTKSSSAYLIPTNKWGSSAIREMTVKLKPWLSKPEDSLELTASLMEKLGSLPANVENGDLEIPLPFRDPRCDSKASIQPSSKRGGG